MNRVSHSIYSEVCKISDNGTYLPQNNRVCHLFHYTSTEVFDKIISSATFRASNIFYLNDAKEYWAGIRKLRSISEFNGVVDEIEKVNARGDTFAGMFSISFSQASDSLHQWITYSKESGICFELDWNLIVDRRTRDNWYCIDSYDKDLNAEQLSYRLCDMLDEINYKNDFNKDAFKEIAEDQRAIYEKLWLMRKACYTKESAYKDEQEVRLVLLPTYHENNSSSIIHYFKMDKGILRPFLNVTIGEIVGDKFRECLPLKTVIIGPSGNQQQVFNSIIYRLRYGLLKVHNYFENSKNITVIFKEFIENILKFVEISSNIESNKTSCFLNNVEYKSLEDFLNKFNVYIENMQKHTILKYNEIETFVIADWIHDNENLFEDKVAYLKFKGHWGLIKESSKKIINLIRDNFFLTKEGIIVKKSTIPYIF